MDGMICLDITLSWCTAGRGRSCPSLASLSPSFRRTRGLCISASGRRSVSAACCAGSTIGAAAFAVR